MGKVQRVTAVISVIVILALAAVLGLFLWRESGRKAGPDEDGKVNGAQANAGGSSVKLEDKTGGDLNENGSEGVNKAVGDGNGSLSGDKTGDGEKDKPGSQVSAIQDATMVFTGDVMMGSAVRGNYDSRGIDGILSEYLKNEMVNADITMINQEFPFSTRGTPMANKQYTFRVDPSYLAAFGDMGVDVVSLANNHALDYGEDALLDTFQSLDGAGIPYAGAGETKERAEQPILLERGGRTVGVLSASRVIPVVSWNIENRQPGMFCTYDSTALVAAIKKVRQQCDYVVVYVHWGVERTNHPVDYQRALAKAYIDAGADLVVGSHPHVPQGIEYYQGKPIVYSLGNFIFNPNMASTYMLKVLWKESGESVLTVIPVATAGAKTRELTGQEGADMLRFIEEISYGVAIDENGIVTQK